MARKERLLMEVTVNVASEKEEEWNDWYNKEHIPAILQCPGFRNVRRFKSLQGNGPRYIAIYEIENESVRETEEFEKARGWSKFTPFIIEPRVTIYREIFASKV